MRGRRWLSPTGRFAQTRPLSQGYGYFGAPRNGRFHGGGDFPGDEVRMPTDAQLIDLHEAFKTDAHGQPKLDKNGNKISIGYIATFNLGNGLHLSLLHLRPSQKLRDFWRDIRTHPGMDRTVRMGNVLGNVDTQAYEGRNDHVHLQITTDGGWYNGQRVKGFAVDPTPFLAPEGQSNEDWGTQLLKTFGLI